MSTKLTSSRATAIKGVCRVPGDKSISHRSLMFGGLAVGETVIEGLLEGEDVIRTAEAMRALGADIVRSVEADGRVVWRAHGRGVGGLVEPSDVLDMGNAGTGARLLMGILATSPFISFLTGDGSLRSRPMKRVTGPLEEFGARFVCRDKGRLPLAVMGTDRPVPVEHTLAVPSAQVKSAVLLAGLNTPGHTVVIEPEITRDHTESMLRHFGADVTVVPEGAGRRITLVGQPELVGRSVHVPGDPSSAAFPVIAAVLVPGSELVVQAICMNPTRTGVYESLIEMGADIRYENQRIEGGEPVADIRVRTSALKGVSIPSERAPSMIDEYLILAMAAACATGKTRLNGLSELRVKESDRLAAIVDGLTACGVEVLVDGDDLIITGTGQPPKGGVTIAVHLDHRIAMSFLVLGMVTQHPVCIDDAAAIGTSFPGFVELMNSLGGRIA